MEQKDIINSLISIADLDDFKEKSSKLILGWAKDKDAFNAIDPILYFMERNPNIDYGSPGPLVHFVEKFYRKGYEQKLIESVQRMPTPHTLWMLNRIINGESDNNERNKMIDMMGDISKNPSIEPSVRDMAAFFLNP